MIKFMSATRLFSKLVDIKPRERTKTFLMFFYFFTIIATVWILKPVRTSLFLEELGAKNLRYVYMGEGLFLIFVVAAFVQLSKKLSRKALYQAVLAFFILSLLVFWVLFEIKLPYLSAYFYVWAASYSIIMTTQFFTLANDIFNPLEAKRLFGFILSGGSIGGVLGGMMTSQMAHTLGTENLLLVIAGLIGFCNVLVMKNWNVLTPQPKTEIPKNETQTSSKNKKTLSGRQLLLGSSYLMMLAGLVVVAKVASAVVDNQFNAVVEQLIEGKDMRTAFYGGFFSFLNALSFAMQLFMTSLVFRYLGVGIALWILPIGLLLGSVGTALSPVLAISVFLKSFDGSMNYSIQQAAREVLYLPLKSQVRYRVKPVIDMLGFRLAKTLGGVYIAIAAPLFNLSDERLGILAICLIPIWVLLVWNMRKGYSQMLRENLVKEETQGKTKEDYKATDVLGAFYEGKNLESVKSFLEHRSSYARKLASMAHLLYRRAGDDFDVAKRGLDHLIRHEAMEMVDPAKPNTASGQSQNGDIAFLENLLMIEMKKTLEKRESIQDYLKNYPEEALMKLGDIIRDPAKNPETKRKAVRILELVPKQEAADLLISHLAHLHQHALRFAVIKALNRLHDQNSKLIISRFLIKSEIVREINLYKNLSDLKNYYSQHSAPERIQNYLNITLKAIQDEGFERMFHLLDLLYPHEMIQMIYDHLADDFNDDILRAHAIELLNNTLDPDLLILMQGIFDRRTKSVKDEELFKILKGFLESHDQWFYLLGVFLIEELKLGKKWPALTSLIERKDSAPIFS